jgi:hypothetical protein
MVLIMSVRLRFPNDFALVRLWPPRLWQLLVKLSNALQARRVLVRDSPLPEQQVAFGLYVCINHVISGHDTETLQERLIGKGSLEASAGILNQTVQDGQGT